MWGSSGKLVREKSVLCNLTEGCPEKVSALQSYKRLPEKSQCSATLQKVVLKKSVLCNLTEGCPEKSQGSATLQKAVLKKVRALQRCRRLK
jgi:hypothetical protein